MSKNPRFVGHDHAIYFSQAWTELDFVFPFKSSFQISYTTDNIARQHNAV